MKSSRVHVALLGACLLCVAACKAKSQGKLKTPGTSTREPLSDFAYEETERSRPPHADPSADPERPAGPSDASMASRETEPAAVDPKDSDALKQTLAELWPDVELSCWSMEGCVQSGDLDGDENPDVIVMVKQLCRAAPCPVGVVVISSRGQHQRLGAGLDPELQWFEWELDKSGKPTWTAGEGARAGGDWTGTLSVTISPSAQESACAKSMQLGHDALVISGSDAAGALVWREGAWALTDCGY